MRLKMEAAGDAETTLYQTARRPIQEDICVCYSGFEIRN
jgi:hypothetical protein